LNEDNNENLVAATSSVEKASSSLVGAHEADDEVRGGSEISGEVVGEKDDLGSEDSLTFSNGVIEKIVAISMREVPGVIGLKGGWLNRVQETFGARDPRKGVSVEVTPDSAVKVSISVMIEYGAYAPQVFEDVKKTVVKQISGMTGLEVAGVNLRIEDVLTPEEYAAGKKAASEAEQAERAEAQGQQEEA
jgi:uncharacterized alkaline shock family protein YloU